MPIISTFFGLIIRIYQGDHNPPHFHAQYGEYNVIVNIKTGSVIGGSLPPRAKKLVNEWRKLHRSELLNTWSSAQKLRSLKKIKPLE